MAREYPKELTSELSEILGMMCFNTSPIAHAFQAAGYDIPTKTEAEQAFILHWLINLYLEHGSDWRLAAGKEIKKMQAQIRPEITTND